MAFRFILEGDVIVKHKHVDIFFVIVVAFKHFSTKKFYLILDRKNIINQCSTKHVLIY